MVVGLGDHGVSQGDLNILAVLQLGILAAGAGVVLDVAGFLAGSLLGILSLSPAMDMGTLDGDRDGCTSLYFSNLGNFVLKSKDIESKGSIRCSNDIFLCRKGQSINRTSSNVKGAIYHINGAYFVKEFAALIGHRFFRDSRIRRSAVLTCYAPSKIIFLSIVINAQLKRADLAHCFVNAQSQFDRFTCRNFCLICCKCYFCLCCRKGRYCHAKHHDKYQQHRYQFLHKRLLLASFYSTGNLEISPIL